MKIRSVGAELFHADGQTDMTKLTVAFRNFANAPQEQSFGSKGTKNLLIRLEIAIPAVYKAIVHNIHQRNASTFT